MNIQGKTVVITGASGGIGSVMARMMAQQGAAVCLLDLTAEKGEALTAEINAQGGKARFFQLDLTEETAWNSAVREVLSWTGRVDALVNNVGINIRKPIEEMSMEEWMTMMRVNTGTVFLGCKAVLPVMRAQKNGVIINMSSVCGLVGHRYTTEAYTATKGAVTLLTKSIASRYASEGIRCNAICPSTVDTPFLQERMQDPVFRKQRFDEVPLGRLATSEDVANAALFLVSEEASFLNGVALPVDGGVTCD